MRTALFSSACARENSSRMTLLMPKSVLYSFCEKNSWVAAHIVGDARLPWGTDHSVTPAVPIAPLYSSQQANISTWQYRRNLGAYSLQYHPEFLCLNSLIPH